MDYLILLGLGLILCLLVLILWRLPGTGRNRREPDMGFTPSTRPSRQMPPGFYDIAGRAGRYAGTDSSGPVGGARRDEARRSSDSFEAPLGLSHLHGAGYSGYHSGGGHSSSSCGSGGDSGSSSGGDSGGGGCD